MIAWAVDGTLPFPLQTSEPQEMTLMKRSQLSALVLMMVLGSGIGASTLLAPAKGKDNPKLGTVKEVRSLDSGDDKKYGYVTERGVYLVQDKKQGKASVCFRGPSEPQEKFYENITLTYLSDAHTSDGGFEGPYYKTKAGNTEFRILFSYNTDVYGRYYVFYADTNNQIFAVWPVLCRAERN